MRKPLEVKFDILQAAVKNAKDAANRGQALTKITDEYCEKAGRKVCIMWVRKRLIDFRLFDGLARSKRGRKSKV